MSTSERDNFDQWLPTDHSYLTAVLATAIFKCILQGVLLAETHRYFSNTPASRDGVAVRVFVGCVMFLVLAHTGVAVAKFYYIAIEHVFWREHWLNIFDTAMNATICLSTQIFFAHRSWNVTRKSNSVAAMLIVLLSAILTSTFGIVITEGISFHNNEIYARTLQIFLYIWGGSSALLELLIVSILFKFLWSSRTGVNGLDRVIVRLLAISLESSLPCLAFVLLLGVTVLAQSVSCNFFAYSTASLYGLSLMVSLNGRHKVQTRLSEYRLQGAFLNVSELQTAGMTESQIFSDDAIAMRRASAQVGVVQAHKGRRPSIMSVVKEVVRVPPPTVKLGL